MLLDWTNVSIDGDGDGTTTVTSGGDTVDVTVTGQGFTTDIIYGAGDYYSPTTNSTSADSTTFNFSSAIENLSFDIYDVDQGSTYDDQIQVIGYDAIGNPVPVTFTNTTHHEIDGNTIQGEDHLDTGGVGSGDAITVNVASPIVSLEIIYSPGDDASKAGRVGYGDMTFDLVNVTCFTTGMEIETEDGPAAVEDLTPGMMIKTHDNGLQELRYLYRRVVRALGAMQPVRFETGSIGNDKPLVVSQKHRMFVGSLPPEMQVPFGQATDHLVQAVELCNGGDIRVVSDMKEVEYFHLMFTDHQLIYSQGTVSESWQPTKAALKRNPEIADELLSIFPELKKRKSSDPGALVRHEVTLNRARFPAAA